MEDGKKIICGFTVNKAETKEHGLIEINKNGKISSAQIIILCMYVLMEELYSMNHKQRDYVKGTLSIMLKEYDFQNFLVMLDLISALKIFNNDDDEIQN